MIIGENNSGKTTIIDALRICLGYGKSDTNIYIQESDLHLNPSDPNEYNTEIQFDLIFEIESEIEKQCFNDLFHKISNIPNCKLSSFTLNTHSNRMEEGDFSKEAYGVATMKDSKFLMKHYKRYFITSVRLRTN
ncbi:MAG: AAA family ATPase [Proteiniphilum sp.]